MARKKKLKGLVWFKPIIQGVEWTVILGSQKDYPKDLEGREAVTLFDRALIIIDSALDPARYPDCLQHELLHAIFHSCGLVNTLRNMDELPLTEKQADKLEETIVYGISPVLYDTYLRNNIANFPEIPTKKRRSRG